MKVSPASTSVALKVPMVVPDTAFSATVDALNATAVGAELGLLTVIVTDVLPTL